MAAGQTVSFVGAAGVLRLDNLPAFHAKISGLTSANQKLDLGGFAFSSGETVTWTQSGTSGTLTVHDGANTATLSPIGTYTNSSFNLHADGHGGTYVSDPPAAGPDTAAAPPAIRFAQALAGFDGGRGQVFAAVHAGGSAVSSPALVAMAMSGRWWRCGLLLDQRCTAAGDRAATVDRQVRPARHEHRRPPAAATLDGRDSVPHRRPRSGRQRRRRPWRGPVRPAGSQRTRSRRTACGSPKLRNATLFLSY